MPSVPGKGGRTPKRSDQRMGHRTKAEQAAVEKVAAAGAVVVPESSEEWHPIAQRWFRSLAESGQARFLEPSDWAAAQYVAEMVTRHLSADRTSAQMFAAIFAAMESLLTTEASRRRVKLEVERPDAGDRPEGTPVTQLDEYRQLYG
jgi:hypothetical protein